MGAEIAQGVQKEVSNFKDASLTFWHLIIDYRVFSKKTKKYEKMNFNTKTLQLSAASFVFVFHRDVTCRVWSCMLKGALICTEKVIYPNPLHTGNAETLFSVFVCFEIRATAAPPGGENFRL